MQMMPNLVKKQFGIWEERRREKKKHRKTKKIKTENAVNKTMQCAQHWGSRGEVGGKHQTRNIVWIRTKVKMKMGFTWPGADLWRERFFKIFNKLSWAELSQVEAPHIVSHTHSATGGKGRVRLLPLLGRLLHFNFDLHSGPKESSKWAY